MKKSAKYFSLIVGLSLFTQSLYGDAGNATVSIGTNGSLWAWGENTAGQLGDGSTDCTTEPVQEVTGVKDWRSVSAGGNHTVAIKTDGTLWGWGANDSGQLGDTWDIVKEPVQVDSNSDWNSISAGDKHTVAIKTDGTLWAGGANDSGQLGNGWESDYNSYDPVQEYWGTNDWSSSSAGGNHTVAIKTDGSLWTWGENSSGQLGTGSMYNSTVPQQVYKEYGDNFNWSSTSAGRSHTVAINSYGDLYSWGKNSSGQLGDGTTNASLVPVREATWLNEHEWSSASAGGNHTVAIKTDGSLWSWGENSSGQLGDGTRFDSSMPVQEATHSTDWSSMSAGGNHTVAIKTDGSLWSWGKNSSGQLGDGTTNGSTVPVQDSTGLNNWSSVSAGDNHTAATKDDAGSFNPSIICYLLF